jgi:transposase
MTQAEREIRRKLRILQHAERSGNVSKTCRYYGVARSLFHTWKKKYELEGEAGLTRKKPVAKTCPHATPPEIVEKVLHLRSNYHLGPMRIVWYMERYHGIKICDATVYRILRRNGMSRLPGRVGRRAVHTHRYAKQVPGHHIQVDVTFLKLTSPGAENLQQAHSAKRDRLR